MPAPSEQLNFGGNLAFKPQQVFQPCSEADVLQILGENRGQKLRAIGRLHSWSAAAVADDVLLDLRHLNQVEIRHEDEGPVAVIGAGCQIKRVLKELDRHGLTLSTVGLISEQTIAGATATGTHGSGKQCTSHYLTALRIAGYDDAGEPLIREVRSGEELRAARCALGCLGIVVSVELRPRPKYYVEEWLAVHSTLDAVLAEEQRAPLQQFYYLPWLDKYLGQHRREANSRSWLAPLYRAYWFLTIDLGLHLVLRFLVQRLRSPAGVKFFFRWLALLTVIRGWRVADRSQDMLIMEHEFFRHIEIELFVRRSKLPAAMEFARQSIIAFSGENASFSASATKTIADLGLVESLAQHKNAYTHHYPVCVRRVLADETLLSMSSGGAEDYYALSFISYALPAERDGFLAFANFLAHGMAAQFDARCHWGKLCPTTPDEAERLYSDLPAFRRICQQFDAQGVFQNAWTEQVLAIRPE